MLIGNDVTNYRIHVVNVPRIVFGRKDVADADCTL